MNLKQGKFPFDSQKCPLEIGSFGYHAGDVQYEWAGQAIEFGKFEMAEMALKEFHHGVRKRDISVCVRVGLRYKMRAFTYFLLSVTLPSPSWPWVWLKIILLNDIFETLKVATGLTNRKLASGFRNDSIAFLTLELYILYYYIIFFKVGLWEGEWLLLAWHLLSPHACCRLLLGRSWNTEFIFLNFQDRLSVVLNWSEWAAHPLSI